MAIDYLIVGHVTQDVTAAGLRPGGTALYAAAAAQRLGRRVGLVTRAPATMGLVAHLPGVALHIFPTERATTFENRYQGDARHQLLHHVAEPLTLDDVPLDWRGAAIVHLAPIAQEVDPALVAGFPDSRICLTPQGWLRGWKGRGEVGYQPLAEPGRTLRGVAALVFSAEDVAHDPLAITALIGAVPLAVVTGAAEGATVYGPRGARTLPARPAQVVDPTGAGDVFAAAFFTYFEETGDVYAAAAFANVVASLSIEQPGTTGIPSRAQAEACMARQGAERREG